MSDGAATIGRGGVAIAMTTGLAASVGLPTAAAAGQNSTAASPAPSASLASQALALTALPRSVTSGAPVSAAAGATVTFAAKQATFTAVPKPKPKPVVKPVERVSTKTSRSTTRTSSSTTTQAPSTNLSGVLAIAARYVGVPYVYGGESPSGFDCSGFSQYVFKQVGISLPRTSSEQYAAVTHISRSEAKPGDLVFFLSGGSVYHLGIYAGGGMMYDSPKPGGAVSKRAIWSATTAYGRP